MKNKPPPLLVCEAYLGSASNVQTLIARLCEVRDLTPKSDSLWEEGLRDGLDLAIRGLRLYLIPNSARKNGPGHQEIH